MANKDNVLFPEYRNEFNVWLHDRLQSLELDEEILGEYITGILYGDDSTLDEKREAVEQTMESLNHDVGFEIFSKWQDLENRGEKQKKDNENTKNDILTEVIERQTKQALNANIKQMHMVDKNVKKSLIAQYAQDLDENFESGSDDDTGQSPRKDKVLFQNTNAAMVMEKEKQQRERQKQDSEDKKVKIKEDKERQKYKVEQRKEKEKKRTQKGERRSSSTKYGIYSVRKYDDFVLKHVVPCILAACLNAS
ncbi:coiled-coil domain-containing protein 43-like [Xenia sp. Carnegie-2017]|uniref:coiled-coil domain-containing protein 43-like n=1 Tax=Xenia sp. Carnegie-2017 TaxID=2897299 RepID=UPI001F0452EE|nr:coiled-coil domain-containing protein 43-like [Xenia sp. Carnegie-2017]